MSINLSILPHFVAYVPFSNQYIPYCCSNIPNYQFSNGENYVGTKHALPDSERKTIIELVKYCDNLTAAELEIKRITSQETPSSSTNSQLNKDIADLKSDLAALKSKYEALSKMVWENKNTSSTNCKSLQAICDIQNNNSTSEEIVSVCEKRFIIIHF